jgi:hypothetical protein
MMIVTIVGYALLVIATFPLVHLLFARPLQFLVVLPPPRHAGPDGVGYSAKATAH